MQNSQENTCTGVVFNKISGLPRDCFWKKHWHLALKYMNEQKRLVEYDGSAHVLISKKKFSLSDFLVFFFRISFFCLRKWWEESLNFFKVGKSIHMFTHMWHYFFDGSDNCLFKRISKHHQIHIKFVLILLDASASEN